MLYIDTELSRYIYRKDLIPFVPCAQARTEDDDEPSSDEEEEVEELVSPVLTIESFEESASTLHEEFCLQFDEHDPDREMISTLVEDYLKLVKDDWVQINEKKVLYADRRLKHARLSKRGDMTETERTVTFTEWVTRDRSNFLQAMSIYQVNIPRLKGKNKTVVWEKKDMAEVWMRWKGRQTFDRVVFEPDETMVGKKEFNMWSPYAINEEYAQKFVQSRGMSKKDVLTKLKPWINHMFHIIADGDKSHFNYIMNWITWVLVKKTKAGTGILLMSDHGAGKSIMAETYAEILGSTHACTLTRSDELTGTFNAHLGFKVLVISEEATYGGSKKDTGHLKNLVTAKTINIRPLYHPLLVMNSRHNLIIISNLNRHVIPIEPTERRYACFYPNGKFSGIQTQAAKKYFEKVLNVPTPLIAYFHYFIWDMTGFNPRSDIPVTACTTDQKIKSADNSSRFVLTKLQTMTAEEWAQYSAVMTLPLLYEDFTRWCDESKINSWQRETMQTFVKSVKRHLLVARRNKVLDNGTYGKSPVMLVRNLARQRLQWAASMGLKKFPSLHEEVFIEEDDEGEDEDEDQTFMDVVLEEGLSDTEREQKIQRSAKRRKTAYRRGCPPTCTGNHPSWVKMTSSGDYEICDSKSKGAIRWHDVPQGIGFDGIGLAPLFVTADADV